MKQKGRFILALTAFVGFLFTGICFGSTAYQVQEKDTLWQIAKKFNVTMESILKTNPDLENEKELKKGQILVIPDPQEDIIPLDDNNTNETHTLILHGSGKQYQPPTQNAVNVMTVDGKEVKIPTYEIKQAKAAQKKESSASAQSDYKYSKKMSSRGTVPGNAILKTAMGYMGVPYVFGGTTPSGFDCSGFVQYVFKLNGIDIPRLAHHQCYAGSPVKKSELRPGDLVFFETYTEGISHVGIYMGNDKFIHASSSGCVKTNNLSEAYYTERYRGAARYYK